MTSTHCAEKTNADSRITDDIIETLKKNNDELNNDLIVLKKLVYMLNVELELRESASRNVIATAPLNLKFKNDYLTKLSTDLKLIHAKEIQTLKTRLKTLESLKCDLEIKLSTVTSERDHLLGFTSAMKTEARQINTKLKSMENELEMSKKNENDTRLQLMKSMSFIRELVSSQNLKTSPQKSFANADTSSYHSN
ncbi:hypothetical protein V9T40_008455 [Parthenolecanium corni]|uniref:Uncharacterized protein n=1 Tax=Parthenolecanium corni TaxID=536013 RepID=A0AAN9TKX2_9HEMI